MRPTKTLCAAALLLPLLLARPAPGYVLKRTSSGSPIRWQQTEKISIEINAHGSDDILDGSELSAAKAAMENWRSAVRHCAFLQFVPLEVPDATPLVEEEGEHRNVIYWEESSWPHDPTSLAITRLFFVDQPGSPRDWLILESDILLNGQHYRFTTSGEPGRVDVENTLTHELGHLVGLDHPCYDGSTAERPTDHLGQPVPDCAAVAAATTPPLRTIRESSMFGESAPGETEKRTVEADDVLGFCALYGLEKSTMLALQAPILQGGCSLLLTPPAGSPASGVLLALFLLLRRRRMSRGAGRPWDT